MKYFDHKELDKLKKLVEQKSPICIFLWGDLGVGKSTFVQEFVAHTFSDKIDVKSPTYLKLLEYKNGSESILHLDCYRIESLQEFEALGFEAYEEYVLCFVEWPKIFIQYKRKYPELFDGVSFLEIEIVRNDSATSKLLFR